MRFVRSLQLLQLGVGQDKVERGDSLADVLRLVAPMIGAVIPGRLATQASATCARRTCRSEAMRATCSTITRSRVGKGCCRTRLSGCGWSPRPSHG